MPITVVRPLVISLLLATVSGCAGTAARAPMTVNPGMNDERRAARLHSAMERGSVQTGLASWYGPKFHGRHTASGERYDMDGLSAAHKTLPFGTVIRVENLDNGRSVELAVNDRGPFVRGRILDVSRAAARQLGMIGPGVARVQISLVAWPGESSTNRRGEERASPRAHGPWVQVGAFREADRARALAERLRAHDPHFDVYREDGWYRVQARLETSRAARSLIRRLADQGIEAIAVRP